MLASRIDILVSMDELIVSIALSIAVACRDWWTFFAALAYWHNYSKIETYTYLITTFTKLYLEVQDSNVFQVTIACKQILTD